MKMKDKILTSTSTSKFMVSKVCVFCKSDEDNELIFGHFYHNQSISVHYYCLLLSSGLSQNGKENEGIEGFLIKDIQIEIDRGMKLTCSYCRKKGATIGCCCRRCKKVFHLPCGRNRRSLHQFFGSFMSYCEHHKPKQNSNLCGKKKVLCNICFSSLSDKDMCLYAPCCRSDWFHKDCIQIYAVSAGEHFFKCPFCNNVEKFVAEMRTHGIHIPEKDASWELEENAYQELLPDLKCDALNCQSKRGRKFNGKSTLWSIISCTDCGSHQRHLKCQNLLISTISWICEECEEMENNCLIAKHLKISNGVAGSVANYPSASCNHTESSGYNSYFPYTLESRKLDMPPVLKKEVDSSNFCKPSTSKSKEESFKRNICVSSIFASIKFDVPPLLEKQEEPNTFFKHSRRHTETEISKNKSCSPSSSKTKHLKILLRRPLERQHELVEQVSYSNPSCNVSAKNLKSNSSLPSTLSSTNMDIPSILCKQVVSNNSNHLCSHTEESSQCSSYLSSTSRLDVLQMLPNKTPLKYECEPVESVNYSNPPFSCIVEKNFQNNSSLRLTSNSVESKTPSCHSLLKYKCEQEASSDSISIKSESSKSSLKSDNRFQSKFGRLQRKNRNQPLNEINSNTVLSSVSHSPSFLGKIRNSKRPLKETSQVNQNNTVKKISSNFNSSCVSVDIKDKCKSTFLLPSSQAHRVDHRLKLVNSKKRKIKMCSRNHTNKCLKEMLGQICSDHECNSSYSNHVKT